MKQAEQQPYYAPATQFQRVEAEPNVGLTTQQVQARMDCGAHNSMPDGVTPSVGKIILQNVLTPFNLINLILALVIVLVGSPKNALFLGIAVVNTLMGIFQELRAKRTLDKLSILARGHVAAVRDGGLVNIAQEEVVLDDILLLSAGGQVIADALVVQSDGLEMDESLLTGEADAIRKKAGDTVLSGSFVSAGRAWVRVCAVGQQSYAGQLSVQAKQTKKQSAPLVRTLNSIIRVLAIVIIPVGGLLFYTQYTGQGNLQASVLGAAAAMVGMIPEGLILLTGVTLTLGAMKLARRKALVQALPSIETLARADVLCLDKTGTITDGTLSFEAIVPAEGCSQGEIAEAVGEMMAALHDDNPTAVALRQNFGGGGGWQAVGNVPFSSARKWSAAAFAGRGSYVLGAPAFVFAQGGPPLLHTVSDYTVKGQRVLCLAHSQAPLPEEGLPGELRLLGLIVLSDTIRAEAPDTFRFFENEGVTLKVISGDDAQTVSTIAQKAGITGAGRFIDMSAAPPDADYGFLAGQYTVFGRVTPEQKKALVNGLKQAGHTVCMTGDGVNDVLAMKEADCGVAMITGSEAARAASDFVLMTGDFSAMVEVLREGRRVINNIENVASLYLVKTIYSMLLSILYVFIPYPYPFAPLQMTPINTLTVGVPSFFLALRPVYEKPKGRFLMNVLENAAPAAITVVFSILVVQLAGVFFGLSQLETSTMNVLLTGAIGFSLLYKVAKPLKPAEGLLVGAMMVGFLGCFLVLGGFFGLGSLFSRNAFFYLPLLYIGPKLFGFLSGCVQRWDAWRQARRRQKAAE